MKRSIRSLIVALAGAASLHAAAAERLVIDFMMSSGPQRSAWAKVVEGFSNENPDVEVVNNYFAQEAYKQNFAIRVGSGKVDLAFWFAGERLRELAARGALTALDRDFVQTTLKGNFAAVTYQGGELDGRAYAFPISYYQWGFFYRKSVFRGLGLNPPQTWAEFLKTCDTLKAAGIAPTAVGARDGWPAAAWFDYLNLRLNGIEFHRSLLRGEARFGDPRARAVFDEWRRLLAKDYFLVDTMQMEWDGVLPYLYRGKVGMALMGGFVAGKIPSMLADDIGFFPFPRMNAEMPMYEEMPLDVLVLPASGENRKAAMRFLAYLARGEALAAFNGTLRTFSPVASNGAIRDPLHNAAEKTLLGASAITFFFDRDAKAGLVDPAFEAFRKFLVPPYDVDAALKRIDKAGVARP